MTRYRVDRVQWVERREAWVAMVTVLVDGRPDHEEQCDVPSLGWAMDTATKARAEELVWRAQRHGLQEVEG